jgi:hypothetical protein
MCSSLGAGWWRDSGAGEKVNILMDQGKIHLTAGGKILHQHIHIHIAQDAFSLHKNFSREKQQHKMTNVNLIMILCTCMIWLECHCTFRASQVS